MMRHTFPFIPSKKSLSEQLLDLGELASFELEQHNRFTDTLSDGRQLHSVCIKPVAKKRGESKSEGGSYHLRGIEAHYAGIEGERTIGPLQKIALDLERTIPYLDSDVMAKEAFLLFGGSVPSIKTGAVTSEKVTTFLRYNGGIPQVLDKSMAAAAEEFPQKTWYMDDMHNVYHALCKAENLFDMHATNLSLSSCKRGHHVSDRLYVSIGSGDGCKPLERSDLLAFEQFIKTHFSEQPLTRQLYGFEDRDLRFIRVR